MRTKTDFVAKAKASWGEALPAWLEILAAEATRTSLGAAAKKIGCTDGLVSAVLANKYKAKTDRVEQKVRGALMNETVTCPILGEIGRDYCLQQQEMPNTHASSFRSKLYRACRSGCFHSRLAAQGSKR